MAKIELNNLENQQQVLELSEEMQKEFVGGMAIPSLSKYLARTYIRSMYEAYTQPEHAPLPEKPEGAEKMMEGRWF